MPAKHPFRRVTHRVAMGVFLTVVMVGCSSASDTTRAGGDPAPVVLHLGTDDRPGTPGADQIEEFARQVETLTDGQVRIEPVWEAPDQDIREWDQAVARMVVAGDLDLGMVPARAFDTEGVATLRALHAPFLVTSEGLVTRIVTGDLAPEMLAGLDDIGLTGLGLVPEGLRRLFTFADQPVTPGTLDGAVVRAPRSDTTWALFRALGAMPDDLDGTEFSDGVANGTVVAAESSFALSGALPSSEFSTDGLVLFPKVNTLVANTDVFNALGGANQDALRAAADATTEWWLDVEQPTEVDQARTYCANGGRIVAPDKATQDHLTDAVADVYDTLEADPGTADMISQIRDLAADVPAPDPIEPCDPPDRPVAAGSNGLTDFPAGFYRADVTTESLTSAGVDRVTAENHVGLWTLGFGADGRVLALGDPDDDCEGTWSVTAGRLAVLLGEGEDCGEAANRVLFSAGWDVGEDDSITFTDVRSGHGSDLLIASLFGNRPFARIGDAPAPSTTPSVPGVSATELDGTYRTTYTVDHLVDIGLPPSQAAVEAGVTTYTLDDGSFLVEWTNDGDGGRCRGTYELTRPRITVRWDDGGGCFGDWSMTYRIDDDQVHFSDVASLPPHDGTDDQLFNEALNSLPWTRVD